MWTQVLEEIISEMKEDELKPQPPASDLDIQNLISELSKLGNVKVLPDVYLEFLRMMNGLNWNGLFIYATKGMPLEDTDVKLSGLVEANEIWRDFEDHSQFLFFAEDSISRYCQDLISGDFKELDNSSDTVIQVYDSFESMFTDALKSSID